MFGREGGMEFAIMSLVQDPLPRLVEQLAGNVTSIRAINEHLRDMEPRREEASFNKDLEDPLTNTILGPDAAYDLSLDLLDKCHASETIEVVLKCHDYPRVVQHYSELVVQQRSIRIAIKEEQESRRLDQQRAFARRHDVEPTIVKLMSAWHVRCSSKGCVRDETAGRGRSADDGVIYRDYCEPWSSKVNSLDW